MIYHSTADLCCCFLKELFPFQSVMEGLRLSPLAYVQVKMYLWAFVIAPRDSHINHELY